MHPQDPWMMRVNADELRREVERNMRIKQAKASAVGPRHSFVESLRRSIGLALIAVGDRIQPEPCKPLAHDPGVELELAR